MELLWNIAVSIPLFGFGGLLLFRCLKGSGVQIGKPKPVWETLSPACRKGAVSQKELWIVWALTLAFRLLIFFAATAAAVGGESSGSLWEPWVRWDAQHYIGLSQQGYAGYLENGTPLFLVFFPLYAWMMRAADFLFHAPAVSGLVVSFLCFAFGCRRLYALAAEEYGRGAARRAVLFLSVFPFAFFFGGIMTESLFLLTTVSALYQIRHHRWWAAGVWGVFAALTRMQGVLIVLAAGVELFLLEKPFSWDRQTWRTRRKCFAGQLVAVFFPLVGIGIYFLLNWRVAGDAFAFVEMQAHWYQGLHPVSGTLWYVLQEAVKAAGEAIAFEIWWPQLILFFAFFAVISVSFRCGRTSFLCYAYGYLIVSYSLSWLLSGGRYLSCDVPVFLFLGALTRKRPALSAVLAGGMAVLFGIYLAAYLSGGNVM